MRHPNLFRSLVPLIATIKAAWKYIESSHWNMHVSIHGKGNELATNSRRPPMGCRRRSLRVGVALHQSPLSYQSTGGIVVVAVGCTDKCQQSPRRKHRRWRRAPAPPRSRSRQGGRQRCRQNTVPRPRTERGATGV